jgi:ABC-type transport system involved in cytochrome c biogenesis permease subunit
VPALGPDKYTFSSPVIRSGWLFLHVSALLLAYAALIFSLIASFLYLLQERRLKNKDAPGFLNWLPPLDTMDQIAQTTLVLGFHGMTIGLLAGSLIAQESVGAAYFADPKVLLSFVMWGLYVVMLFVRRSTGLRGRRAVYLSSVVFLVMLSVWAANLLSTVHRFSAP